MNNLDVNTIWFEDGTYLNSAKGLVGTAGGLSFNIVLILIIKQLLQTQVLMEKLDLALLSIADSISLYISTQTLVLSNQTGSPIDMTNFFNYIQARTSAIKTFVIIYKKTDSSKKIIFSVSDINVNNTYNHATFTLDREVAFSSDSTFLNRMMKLFFF